jgi:hypothetical protein
MGWKCSPGSTTRRGRPFPRRTFGGAKSGSHGRHDRLLKQPSNWRPGTAPACPIVYLTEGYRPRCATKINQADNRHRRAFRALGARWEPMSYFQNRSVAIRAPSASAVNFAQTMSGSTAACPTQVPYPQSLPAITFSLPTNFA